MPLRHFSSPNDKCQLAVMGRLPAVSENLSREKAIFTERSRQVIENKGLEFLEADESRQVVENTGTYRLKAVRSLIAMELIVVFRGEER